MSDCFERNGPVPKNDERLFRPTKVNVLRPFYLNRERQEPGTVATLPHHLAADMVAIGKAAWMT